MKVVRVAAAKDRAHVAAVGKKQVATVVAATKTYVACAPSLPLSLPPLPLLPTEEERGGASRLKPNRF
jgi:hypothetical protein